MEYVSSGSGIMFSLCSEKGTMQVLKGNEINSTLPQIDFMHLPNIGYM